MDIVESALLRQLERFNGFYTDHASQRLGWTQNINGGYTE